MSTDSAYSVAAGQSAAATSWLADPDPTTRTPQKTLGQEDFLKLLVAQMTSQDPLNPKADLDSIAQMAQFSALEQTKTLQSELAALRSDQRLLQANALLGRTVALQADAETIVAGIVDAVRIEAGTPQIVVNGQSYDLSQLVSVTPTTVQASTPQHTQSAPQS